MCFGGTALKVVLYHFQFMMCVKFHGSTFHLDLDWEGSQQSNRFAAAV